MASSWAKQVILSLEEELAILTELPGNVNGEEPRDGTCSRGFEGI